MRRRWSRAQSGNLVNKNHLGIFNQLKFKFRYGYKFLARKPESVVIETPEGAQEEYDVLNVIEFTSSRKRMSVIVRDPRGRIRLLTKGPLMNDVS